MTSVGVKGGAKALEGIAEHGDRLSRERVLDGADFHLIVD